ncbi:hypothetical protein UFOVP505_16 [uncultured Caudovirales phage]|uniref:Uncharacterized protein n=1 Tax=uncultured Caudovirales phage TaxID=2100421 RepID=A0A6J5MKT8_9CAUD|nr:hypothetical protein UFOVP505_16 [uncultured Caudovirales phage]
MTLYKTGRSTDYRGAEAPPKRYAIRPYENTTEIIDQFERMHKGFVPVCADGSAIVWVQDSTLSADDREWCWQTARQIEREAEIAAIRKPRAASPLRRNVSQIESEIAAVLALRPDATAHDIRIVTGIEHSRVLRSETSIMAHMGEKVKHG